MSETIVCGGIVLCGGQSTRMGRPKAWLPFGPEFLLQRVVRLLSEAASPVVVVAARGQDVPELPDSIRVVRDEYDSLGPLAGLAAGLSALQNEADAAFLSSCDAPLLKPEFVRHMFASLGPHAIAVPRDSTHVHSLAGVYRCTLEPAARELIAAGRLRLGGLVEQSDAQVVEAADLRSVDLDLESLRTMNTPAEYAAALRLAGFPVPQSLPPE